MKILEIIPTLSSGGAERFVIDLCNQLLENEDVQLVTFFPFRKNGFYLQNSNSKLNIISLNKKLGLDISIIYKLYKVIKKYKPDIIHTHLNSFIYLAPLAFLFPKTKFFHTIHSEASAESGDFFSSFIRKFLFKIKKIIPITISKESLKSFINYYGFSTHLIPNGRNINKETLIISSSVQKEINKYCNHKKKPIIVNLARLMNVKRQPLIAKICKRLYQEGHDFIFLMIGRTENTIILEEIKKLKSPCVHILGEKSNPLEYLMAADGFCLFSSREGLPISLLEALATGTIPICTPVGGIKDLICDGENGILAQDLNEQSCYHALKRFLLLTDSQKKQMKSNTIKTFDPYSMNICASNYLKLFSQYTRIDVSV